MQTILNLDTATVEQLKSAAYDNLRQIEQLQRQQEILNNVIVKKEKEIPETPKVEKK